MQRNILIDDLSLLLQDHVPMSLSLWRCGPRSGVCFMLPVHSARAYYDLYASASGVAYGPPHSPHDLLGRHVWGGVRGSVVACN